MALASNTLSFSQDWRLKTYANSNRSFKVEPGYPIAALGPLHATQSGVMAALVQALSTAGLSATDIAEVLADGVSDLVAAAAAYEHQPLGRRTDTGTEPLRDFTLHAQIDRFLRRPLVLP